MPRCYAFIAIGLTVFALSLQPAAAAPPSDFAAFVNDYYTQLFTWDPSQATMVGIHDYDDRMPDFSAAAYSKRAADLKKLQSRLAELQKGKLAESDAIDAELLDHLIRAELLEIETVRSWTRDPTAYLGSPAGAIDLLMKRTFAPPADRLKSVIARLKASPPLLKAMRENMTVPPKEFADLGIIVANGSVGFFRDTLPEWAKTAAHNDAALLAEFDQANKPLIAAFEETAKWLKDDLLPRAKGSYAIGADAFLKKLQYEEMLDIPLDRLLAIGEANLKRDRASFLATAKMIDANATPREVLKRMTDNHPSADELVGATRGTLERIRQFLIDKHIITVHSEVRPTVLETPAFQRTGGFASMDTPGAYEAKATEAFYYVTPPEKDWSIQRQTEHLRGFNFPVLQVISIHEAFPGHYLQFLNAKLYPTKTRKLYFCGTNVEGWAHYTEQMMVEEGYGGGDPKIQLAQLHEALLRDCRYVVGIKLHTQGMTVAEGTKYFMEQGFIEEANGFQEARRGCYNPTYLYYTLGKLQIYKLRADYKKAKGDAFKLQSFHDEFVRQGGIPLKLIRKIMLPGDTGPTLD